MKPNIDLNSPFTQLALSIYQKEIVQALEMEQTVEKAVIPIAYIPKSKAHQQKKTKPEQIGTGVLVNIKDEYFIFTATHVLNEFEGKSLIVGTHEYSPYEELIGVRFSSGTMENKIDKFDATVFHIQNQISETLKSIAITLEDFDVEGNDDKNPVYMITGFLAKESNTSGNEIRSKLKNFPSVEINEYEEFGYDNNGQIMLAYENQVLINNQWKMTPRPRGMSGGAIIKAHGTDVNLKKKENQHGKQLLTAITIEQHRDKGKKLGFLLGTRINVHLGLIYKFMPELLEDFLNEHGN